MKKVKKTERELILEGMSEYCKDKSYKQVRQKRQTDPLQGFYKGL